MPHADVPATGGLRRRGRRGRIAVWIVISTMIPAAASPCRRGLGEIVNVSAGAAASNTVPTVYEAIEVHGSDGGGTRSTYVAEAPLTLTESLRSYDRGLFEARADVRCDGEARATSGGTIHLGAGTLTAPSLDFDGQGAVTRGGGHYRTDALGLASGASLTYGPDDAILFDVNLSTGASLSLARDLSTRGHVTIDGAATTLDSAGHALATGYLDVGNDARLRLDGDLSITSGGLYLYSGGSIERSMETISAPFFVVENARLDLLAGDTFLATETCAVSDGGVVNAPTGTILGDLSVAGTDDAGHQATFNVLGDVTLGNAAIATDGVLALVAGTLSARSLSVDGSAPRPRGGGHYDVGVLLLSGGATFAHRSGDGIDSLAVDGVGSLLEALAPLTLSSLSLSAGGILDLGDFTGTGAVGHWGLRMPGDETSLLDGLISSGLLTAGGSPLSAIFAPGPAMTYVTVLPSPVPEIDPTSPRSVVVLLVGALGLRERRLRRSAGHRECLSPRPIG